MPARGDVVRGAVVRIYPKPLEIGDEEGFTPQRDLFGRAKLGISMSKLVSLSEDPLVIALDGPWGSGKTVFLKMWAGELRKEGHLVIYFDAFESDYIEDAFSAIAGEIVALAESKMPIESTIIDRFKKGAVAVASVVAANAVKLGAKAATRVVTAGILTGNEFEEIKTDIIDESSSLIEKYIENIIKSSANQKKIINNFRDSLSKIPNSISDNGNSNKKLIIIVDELDRCKPAFALQLLERIKHFFSVDGVCFVLGVNVEQLKSSVCCAYGGNIDANIYLQKFIHLCISIPMTDMYGKFSNIEKYIDFISQGDRATSVFRRIIMEYKNKPELSYRMLDRIYIHFKIMWSMLPNNNSPDSVLCCDLMVLKFINPQLYQKARNGSITINDIEYYKNVNINRVFIEMNNYEKWLNYCLSDNLSNELLSFGNNALFDEGYSNRKDIIPHLCRSYIDTLYILK